MPAKGSSRVVDVFVEIPRGSHAKYELDHKGRHIRLDRVPRSSVHYPADYGFVMKMLKDLAPHWQKEIERFFATSKTLEKDNIEVRGWHDEKVAWPVIEAARRRKKRPA